MCDCWIGILNSYTQISENDLNISSYIKKVKEAAEVANSVSWNKEKIIAAGDYLDRRKGMSNLFNFCPCCGRKINWRDLRSKVKNGGL